MSEETCPACGAMLHWTYKIDQDFYETHESGDPRIYGVICTNCCYEHYDDEDEITEEEINEWYNDLEEFVDDECGE